MRFNVQEAKKAIREMNGATIAGQEIKVGKSWKPPELAKFGWKFYSLLSLALSTPIVWITTNICWLYSVQVKKAEPKKKGVDCGPGSGAGGYRDGRTGGYGEQLILNDPIWWNDDHYWSSSCWCFSSDASGRRLAGDLGRVGAGYGGHDGVEIIFISKTNFKVYKWKCR